MGERKISAFIARADHARIVADDAVRYAWLETAEGVEGDLLGECGTYMQHEVAQLEGEVTEVSRTAGRQRRDLVAAQSWVLRRLCPRRLTF